MTDVDRQRREEIDEMLSSTFNSILRIEEKSLANRLTQGLTISEIHTIDAIGYQERNPMNVVAARLDVTMATLTIAVNKLADKGFVVRERDEADKRRVLISLTKKGRQVYRAHRMFHKRMVDEALAALTPEEEQVFLSAITKVDRFFKEQARDDA